MAPTPVSKHAQQLAVSIDAPTAGSVPTRALCRTCTYACSYGFSSGFVLSCDGTGGCRPTRTCLAMALAMLLKLKMLPACWIASCHSRRPYGALHPSTRHCVSPAALLGACRAAGMPTWCGASGTHRLLEPTLPPQRPQLPQQLSGDQAAIHAAPHTGASASR